MKHIIDRIFTAIPAAILTLGLFASLASAATILSGGQGGTGFATTTAPNSGKCLIVSSTNPLSYKFDTCGSGGGTTTTINDLQQASFTIQGTANRVTVASTAPNVITLSGPQDLAAGSAPTFAGISFTNATGSGSLRINTLTATTSVSSTGLTFTNATGSGSISASSLSISGTGTFGVASATSVTFTNATGSGNITASSSILTNVSSTNGDFSGRLTAGGFPVSTSTGGGAKKHFWLMPEEGSSNITVGFTTATSGIRYATMPNAADSWVNFYLRLDASQTVATATIKALSPSGSNTDTRITLDWVSFGANSTVAATDDSSGPQLHSTGFAACGGAGSVCVFSFPTSSFNAASAQVDYIIRLLREGNHASDTNSGAYDVAGLQIILQ